MSIKKMDRVKIIGGRFRGRSIYFSDAPALRPTPNRVRETLFNWLMNFSAKADCLDAFVGSGALSFEALSRGAATVLAIEQNPQFITSLVDNTKRLQITQLKIVCDDFFKYQWSGQKFHIVFLDPPFYQNFLVPALLELERNNLLAAQHRIYFEVEKEFLLEEQLPSQFSVVKNQVAGQVRYGLLQLTQAIEPKIFTKIQKKIKVLLVEDDALIQLIHRYKFEQLGCEVTLAINGKEALEYYASHYYDIAFIDIGLPDINGVEVITRMRQVPSVNNLLYIVALTAYLDEASYEKAFAAGANNVLVKPLDEAKLTTIFSGYFDAQRSKIEG